MTFELPIFCRSILRDGVHKRRIKEIVKSVSSNSDHDDLKGNEEVKQFVEKFVDQLELPSVQQNQDVKEQQKLVIKKEETPKADKKEKAEKKKVLAEEKPKLRSRNISQKRETSKKNNRRQHRRLKMSTAKNQMPQMAKLTDLTPEQIGIRNIHGNPTYIFKGKKVEKRETPSVTVDSSKKVNPKNDAKPHGKKFNLDMTPYEPKEPYYVFKGHECLKQSNRRSDNFAKDLNKQKNPKPLVDRKKFNSAHDMIQYEPKEPYYVFKGDEGKKQSNRRPDNLSQPRTSTPLPRNRRRDRRRSSKPLKTESLPPELKRIKEVVTPLMLKNFKTILSRFPDGITITDFFVQYEKIFRVQIIACRFGFSSSNALIEHYHKIFRIQKLQSRTTLFLLYDAKLPTKLYEDDSRFIPSVVLRRIKDIVYDHRHPVKEGKLIKEYSKKYSFKLDPKSFGYKHFAEIVTQVPDVDIVINDCVITLFKKGNYDDSIFRYNKKRPNLWICDDELGGDFLGLKFTYKRPTVYKNSNHAKIVENQGSSMFDGTEKSHFFIQFTEFRTQFKKLMVEINAFYNENMTEYTLENVAFVPNLPIMVQFNQMWYRALILQKGWEHDQKNQTEINVLFVDYGTVKCVKKQYVKAYSKKFADYPIYAVAAKFYGITYFEGKEFKREIDQILMEHLNKDVYIKIAGVGSMKVEDTKYPLLDLVVVDQATNRCLNEKLVERGVAVFEEEDEIAGKKLEIRLELIEKNTDMEKVLPCYHYR